MNKDQSDSQARPGAGKGMGPGNSPAGWPSTKEGNPSGGNRSNNPPKK